jgi:putative ABC transport system substrate-binding protein
MSVKINLHPSQVNRSKNSYLSLSVLLHSYFILPKKLIKASLLYLCLCAFSFNATLANAETSAKVLQTPHKTIGISQIIEHSALDTVRNSMIAALKAEGFEIGKNLTLVYENAQGNMVTATQIATKLTTGNLDVLIGISTPSSQTLLQAAQKLDQKIPIVFTAVTDPEKAKLTEKIAGYPITGISDDPNLKGFIELITKIHPKLKKLGVLYNPSEVNSVTTINRLRKLLKEKNIELVEASVNSTADVPQATQSLIGKVDLLYFPQDNTLVAALQSVINVANHGSPELPIILPIYTDDPKLLKGVLAVNGYDYRDIGHETGIMVAKILKGKKIEDMPIQNPPFSKTVINKSKIQKLELTLPKPDELKYSKTEIVSP